MKKLIARRRSIRETHRRELRRILREFHVRAFGEELARINFLPEKRRKRAVAEMIDHARRKGVRLGRPALGCPV